ncbi:MAG: YceI family protein [Cytophagales bacterium]|nr:YceI family protein [Cytophagales bacterium]
MKHLIFLFFISFYVSNAQVTYIIDNGHSNVNFAIPWREISFRTGEFKSFNGEITTKSETDLTDASVRLSVEVGSIDVIADKLNKMLQEKDYLDSASCPIITYTCTGLKKIKDNVYEANGDLTLKCKTQKVKFMVEDNGRRDKYAAIKVTGVVPKSQFGIVGGGDRLGDGVQITAFFEMVKKK